MMIGGLFAKLSLNTASFEGGIKRARSTMFRAAKDMAVLSAAATAGGAALGAMANASVQSAREIKRLSQVAGATPGELQRWSAATRTVGIDQEKLADILKDVNDRIGQAATGEGEMMDFFTNIAPKVGVTIKQFEKLSGPEALQLYVSSLEKAGVNGKEMTRYMEQMASDSTLLTPLLKNNATELNRLGDAAQKAGGIMDQTTIDNLLRAGAAFDSLKSSAVGMRNTIAGAMAPSLENLANVLKKTMQEGGALRRMFGFLGDNAGRISAYITAAAAAFAAYSGAVIIATAVTQGFKRALIRTGLGAIIVGLGEAVYQFTSLTQAIGDSGKAFDMFKDLAKGAVNYAVEAFFWFGNRLIGIGRGAVAGFKEIFWSLSDIVNSVFVSAINGALSITQDGLNKMIGQIRSVQVSINTGIAKMGGGKDKMLSYMQFVEFGGIQNNFEGSASKAGKRAGEAFMEGFNKDTRGAPKVFDVPAVTSQWNKIQTIIKGSRKETVATTEAVTGLDTAFSGLGATAEDKAAGYPSGVPALTAG